MKQDKPRPAQTSTYPTICSNGGHARVAAGCWPSADSAALDRAARLFRAMGDGPRLRLLYLLAAGECCVTKLVDDSGEKFSTVSQRLRVLRAEGLVARRRVGLHVYYSLTDRHVSDLVANALAHAGDLSGAKPRSQEDV